MNCGKRLDLGAALASLEKLDLRVTRPRMEILKALADSPRPATIDELHQRLKGRCDWATVFRCLKKFEEIGLVSRCEFGDKQSRYEMAESGSNHHHHLVCRDCGRIEEVGECGLNDLEKRIQARSGFSAISHSLEFFGLCPACKHGP